MFLKAAEWPLFYFLYEKIRKTNVVNIKLIHL
jgi:hypothetical protein